MAKKKAARLEPLNDRVVVTPVQQEQVLESGLVIPDTAKEKPQQGEVVAVGPGRRDEAGTRVPVDIQIGDRVLYKKYTGQDIKIDRQDLIVLQESEILAKVIV
jgi:chaperonin GroES